MATVFIPSLLRDLTGGSDRVEVPGATVRQVVNALEARYPGLRERICEGDQLSPRVQVAVDGHVSRLGMLERVGEASEVHFIPAISGGAVAKPYEDELVYIRTEDGLPLEGAIIRPTGERRQPIPLLFVHGLTGKFYSQTIVMIGRELASRGYTFVTGNNRGHDGGYPVRLTPDSPPRIYGGSWEDVFECVHDISAWLSFTVGLGFERVGLLGHSLGARKVALYQGTRNDGRVAGLVTASPPIQSVRPRPELIAQAEAMVAAGRGQDLLPWGLSPAGMGTSSARAYLDRFKPGWDIFGVEGGDGAIGQVRCPLLAFYGTNEAWVGGASELEMIKVKARAAARVETRLFEGADHSYTGQHVEVGQALAAWLATLR
jgi:molybdopterin synthase sulfur carrier subunit